MLSKNKILNFIGIGSLCLFLLGCSRESFLIAAKDSSSTVVLEEEIVLSQENSEIVVEEISAESDVNEPAEAKMEEIAVHICGAVNIPGVYFFQEKQRLYEAILKAGGFREDADTDYLNQALFLEDGMKIVVPTKEETRLLKVSGAEISEKEFLEDSYSKQRETEEQKQKINLNTADKALLCTLPGIGESRADSIIAYRQENGEFERTEDIMKVSGIKEAAYEKIKDYVTVSK